MPQKKARNCGNSIMPFSSKISQIKNLITDFQVITEGLQLKIYAGTIEILYPTYPKSQGIFQFPSNRFNEINSFW